MSESKKQARLREVTKGLKPTRLPTSEAEYRAQLDAAATELSGKPPALRSRGAHGSTTVKIRDSTGPLKGS